MEYKMPIIKSYTNEKGLKFPDWEVMSPGEHPIHKHYGDVWIKWDKGHDVTRPNFKYSTSKWEQSLIDMYEILFDPFKHIPITLLEFGVYGGESIRYFRDFFTHPDTKIVGLDRSLCEAYGTCGPYAGNKHNVFLEQGNQANSADIKRVCDKFGPFDVIIDDASHDVSLTDACFRDAWPHLAEGGLYLIEDVLLPKLAYLLDEIVLTKQGKGFTSAEAIGFGPQASRSRLIVLKKTKDTITGLEL